MMSCQAQANADTTSATRQPPYAKKAKPLNQHEKLRRSLAAYCSDRLGLEWNEAEWHSDLPRKYKLCPDIVILPANCFQLSHWFGQQRDDDNNDDEAAALWKTVASAFNVRRVARENAVKPDDYRSPNLTLLYGSDPIVCICNNDIKYSYDITKCMFSWGNITEKLRIASFDCSDEVVVDLFAGIGYFTLVYLVHARARRVIACEWNPASVEALRNNLTLNKIEPSRCQILAGDNRLTCPTDCADRVNLGLIPSSEESWPTACRALRRRTGGRLHIHGNVDIAASSSSDSCKSARPRPDWLVWAQRAQASIRQLLVAPTDCVSTEWSVSIEHVEYVKSYGPRVDHLVVDLLCRPVFNQAETFT